MEDFFRWVREARATTPGRNLATKALGYAMNQDAELLRMLDDEKLPLDNTRSEIFSVLASCRLMRSIPRPCQARRITPGNVVHAAVTKGRRVRIATWRLRDGVSDVVKPLPPSPNPAPGPIDHASQGSR